MKRLAGIAVALLALLHAVPAYADGISGMSVSPGAVKVGQKVTVTVNGTLGPGNKCRVYYKTTDPFVDKVLGDISSFPTTFQVSFSKPGVGQGGVHYVHVWTGTTGENPCDGKGFNTTVKVTAAGIVLQPGRLAASPCPPGWVVKAHEASSGFLTCVPRKPATKIQCPPKTQYVETECMVGCKPVPY
ncbi:MAG: hypothetical protein A3E31_14685 [Candidatus Rokubacteria bacterium RIFCSPHIGHO2_12_FULL_73_22]|nr:MAG: hypothetical protein A3E31_14685 [Candidatus Rokubacteria bacterium RIFCSPHIGHO2_12_FULL_73_22]